MNKEDRRKLASLTFSEKIRILEKLRERSLALAASRRRLEEKRKRSPKPE